MRLDETVFYSVCCICCLSRRDSRGWDAMAYPRPACLGGEMLGLAYARRCYARRSDSSQDLENHENHVNEVACTERRVYAHSASIALQEQIVWGGVEPSAPALSGGRDQFPQHPRRVILSRRENLLASPCGLPIHRDAARSGTGGRRRPCWSGPSLLSACSRHSWL
jgi:hypothetical protein